MPQTELVINDRTKARAAKVLQDADITSPTQLEMQGEGQNNEGQEGEPGVVEKVNSKGSQSGQEQQQGSKQVSRQPSGQDKGDPNSLSRQIGSPVQFKQMPKYEAREKAIEAIAYKRRKRAVTTTRHNLRQHVNSLLVVKMEKDHKKTTAEMLENFAKQRERNIV